MEDGLQRSFAAKVEPGPIDHGCFTYISKPADPTRIGGLSCWPGISSRKSATQLRSLGRRAIFHFMVFPDTLQHKQPGSAMRSPDRFNRISILLSLAVVSSLVAAGALSLAHCHGGHEHGRESGSCAICAFACHMGAGLLAILSLTYLELVCRFRQRPLGLSGLGSDESYQLIRAPPLHTSIA